MVGTAEPLVRGRQSGGLLPRALKLHRLVLRASEYIVDCMEFNSTSTCIRRPCGQWLAEVIFPQAILEAFASLGYLTTWTELSEWMK